MANRLEKARSPYLRKAANQPVDWFEWSEEAFKKAKEEDKPILLSVGGVWCHWCHVMAKKCFENEDIAKIINENFVAVKVDRDERPDIDRRYQEFVFATTGTGGWPLTVFLTPDGEPFFGGTYFPPEDGFGMIGFKTLLLKISEMWEKDRESLLKSAKQIVESLKKFSERDFSSNFDFTLIEKGIKAVLDNMDYVNGGIGRAPKFHHAKAFELLLTHYYFTKDEDLIKAVELTLDAMAKGGVYDQLIGGFFRYSTDDRWHVPHFEKMLYDNAELLKLYTIAYQITKKELYRKVAKGIVDYYRKFGVDERGGFYASQDADIGELEEGGYYIFSLEEIKEVLNDEEFRIASLYFGLREGKNVLHVSLDENEISEILGIPVRRVKEIIESAKEKLLEVRERRETPFIDKTIYTNWNGLMIEAMCDYYKSFNDPWAVEVAEKSGERLLKFWDGDVLLHTDDVEGFSEDYIFFAKGLIALFEITQKGKYLNAAVEITKRAVDLFWDHKRGGFFDRKSSGNGLLSLKVKDIQDSPQQSVNGIAPLLLTTLSSVTGTEEFGALAKKSLRAFAGILEKYPLISPSYMISLYAYIRGIYLVKTRRHFEEMLRTFRPFKFVIRDDSELVCEGNVCRSLK
ncbi:protein of unknown function DUF255 [Ferroglobus placidus DSM 10642]|uniref:Spermatogenesis-associated protein 20-like TRX domain-containing protein n=1 Tax=Ferroglobus placidus (strain DSM 10642 / AEDII12DO) TaxID=589924 RepID=D3S045_FERPA|nr:thioredoxin domain-containing protein [Ferroglobus placidus]ADC66108.1 protein of unknown function DUF255 [Ferroglobus placidus DSM 10642]